MIILKRNSKVPLYEQIYNYISNEIISGRFTEGTRLTSTRVMASSLNVGRNTVERAYLQLCDEGYLENKIGSGYYVNYFDMNLASSLKIGRNNFLHKDCSQDKKDKHNKYKFDLKYGTIDIEYFPIKKWRKALEEAIFYDNSSQIISYSNSNGKENLIKEIIDYLYKSRGVSCNINNVIVGTGTQHLINSLCDVLDRKYNLNSVAIEDPGYDGVRKVFENHNYNIIPVPVEEDGINIEFLKQSNAKIVYVTPSHQFPSGVVLPIQKKMQLIKWAKDNDAFIIEDDYDSELRYTSHSIPAIQGIDKNDRVIYLGTFSKVLSPALRISYMVLPNILKKDYDNMFESYHNGVSDIIQDAIRIFMSKGNWNTYIRKICIANKRKHNKLVETIERELGEYIEVKGKGAGLHIILESKCNLHQDEIIKRGEKLGLKIYPVSKYWIEKERYHNNQVILGFGGIDFEDVEEVVSIMKKIFL